MTLYEETVTKLRQMPEGLIEEVNDFINFILMRHDSNRWQLWNQFSEGLGIAEIDFPDYLSNLQDYEDRLALGEIKW
ncbi:MAG: hypothetical protein HY879_07695 [Deltaproteobacteria bacterium]|nr:hypothetical protein [Deltaproteobacteria bacterium]